MIIKFEKYNAFFRQLLFLTVLIAIGVIMLKQLSFFVGSFLGAITLYTVLRKSFFDMTENRRWSPVMAALFLVVMATLLLSAIGYFIYEVVASGIPTVDITKVPQQFNSLLDRIGGRIGMDLVPENLLQQSAGLLTKLVSSLINTTYSLVINILLMMVILYFMLVHARRMEEKLTAYAPFKGYSLCMLKKETKNIIYSNAIGIPIIMVAQALTACLIYWLLGLDNILFWGFITAVCGLIPMIGTVIVSFPLGTYLIVNGHVWQGIVLIICGLFVIANVDNLCRIVLMKRMSNTHPLIVIFGVILGIPLFGFWGIIFGPLLISAFLLLIRIYYLEYGLLNKEQAEEEVSGECVAPDESR